MKKHSNEFALTHRVFQPGGVSSAFFGLFLRAKKQAPAQGIRMEQTACDASVCENPLDGLCDSDPRWESTWPMDRERPQTHGPMEQLPGLLGVCVSA